MQKTLNTMAVLSLTASTWMRFFENDKDGENFLELTPTAN